MWSNSHDYHARRSVTLGTPFHVVSVQIPVGGNFRRAVVSKPPPSTHCRRTPFVQCRVLCDELPSVGVVKQASDPAGADVTPEAAELELPVGVHTAEGEVLPDSPRHPRAAVVDGHHQPVAVFRFVEQPFDVLQAEPEASVQPSKAVLVLLQGPVKGHSAIHSSLDDGPAMMAVNRELHVAEDVEGAKSVTRIESVHTARVVSLVVQLLAA